MDKFMNGIFLAFFISVLVIVFCDNPVIRSNKKLIPTWELTTNGKTIDTIYIYKNEKIRSN